MQENPLRGRIISLYHSLRGFAKAIGWSDRKVYDIVKGKQEPTAKDIETMCEALHVDVPEDMKILFFP